MNWRGHIVSGPEILVGKPVVKGTRLSADLILDRLADGWTAEDLFKSHQSAGLGGLRARW